MANIKDQVAVLLNQKMDRKDFLKYVAAAGVMAVGGSMIMQSVAKLDQSSKGKKVSQAAGYGASAYGGKPKA